VTELIEALGWRVSLASEMLLLAMIGGATFVLLILGTAAAAAGPAAVIAVQVCIWVLWLAWLGQAFPRNAERDSQTPCPLPYRRAFTREILFGIAVAFSQMLRPAFYGLLASGVPPSGWAPAPPLVVVGVPLAALGVTVIAFGVSTLGMARTLFVYEYVSSTREVTAEGIYQILRHPLFLGGTAVSTGLAALTGDPVAIALAFINVGVVPIYVRLEDRRCCTVLGRPYVDYRAAVGGMVPRRRSLIR
jgi:protein-S-isoprenylcysteine O-methyltransferase Ste14